MQRFSDPVADQVVQNTQDIHAVGQGLGAVEQSLGVLEQRVQDNDTNTKKLTEYVVNIDNDLTAEVNDRIAKSATMNDAINRLDKAVQNVEGKVALDKEIGTITALLAKLQEYKNMAKDPKQRDQIPISAADLENLIQELEKTALVQIEKGPDKHDKTWFQRWFNRDATTKQLWETILQLKIVPTTDYSVKKVQYERSSNTASMVELIKLGNYLVTKTGREYGPDLALTIDSIPSIDFATSASDDLKNLINQNTSITELLNILAFLTHSDDTKRLVDPEISVDSAKHNGNGEYVSTPLEIINGVHKSELETWNLCLIKLDGAPIFSTETMDVHTNFKDDMTIYIPSGILKRKLDNSARGRIEIKKGDVKPLFTACTRQMIKILTRVRSVFAGWTSLSRATIGGSTKSKTKTKKTRRRYRRRY